MGAMNALALRGVTKSFGGHVAVDDLSLDVPRGAVYGFIGPNGSGKSTTIRMIMNILLPDRGEIEVLGERGTRAARDRVGYLPEERGLYKKMPVRRVLDYFGRLKGRTRAEVTAESEAWLERLGLAAWADKKVEALSKGMAQKVQFIAAVAAKPELLILDEPFSGLDPVNMEALKDAILELRRRGVTILFSTHDMAVAERMCDRIFMIFRGRKVLDGTLAEIQARYGEDVIRVATDGGADVVRAAAPAGAVVNDYGRVQEIRGAGDPQALLRALAERTAVRRFEIAHPSLHDVFVRIAGADAVMPAAPRGDAA
ncbi:MAG TPA: ATP-binding cassette domain-containing protein [Planctomycetota bacterium]|nr:ATP-binding cassette domain-containing protein [Planctomycetota bacterium]